MKVPDLYVGKRLFVGQGVPPIALGLGPSEIRGASYIQGTLNLRCVSCSWTLGNGDDWSQPKPRKSTSKYSWC